jgi:hypothetical protein
MQFDIGHFEVFTVNNSGTGFGEARFDSTLAERNRRAGSSECECFLAAVIVGSLPRRGRSSSAPIWTVGQALSVAANRAFRLAFLALSASKKTTSGGVKRLRP